MRKFLLSPMLWLGVLIGAASVAVPQVVAIYLDMERTTVSVRNHTSQPFNDLKIDVAGVTAWTGQLAPDRTRTVSIVTPGDGVVSVEFTRNGEHVKRDYGYVSTMIGDDYFILVRETGEPEVLTSAVPPSLGGWFRDGER